MIKKTTIWQSLPQKRKKWSDIDGWGPKTTFNRIKKKKQHTTLGDWQRFGTIKLKYLVPSVKWRRIDDDKVVTFVTPKASGVKNVLLKMQSQQNKNIEMLPVAMKEKFDVQENYYDPKDYDVTVSFSDSEEYQSFSYAFCHLCSNKKVLKKSYWEAYPEKLPEDESLSNLIDYWDSLSQSWNQTEVLACILPNDPAHTQYVNAKMILRPENHWRSVHEEKKGTKKSVLLKQLTYVSLKSVSSTAFSEEVSSSNAIAHSSNSETSDAVEIVKQIKTSKKLAPSLKRVLASRKTYQQPKIDKLIEPSINFVGYAPKNDIEKLAMRNTLKCVPLGCISGISDATTLKFHSSSQNTIREYHCYKCPNDPPPQRVKLNSHNFHKAVYVIVEAYRRYDQSTTNLYRQLEKSQYYSLIHDATTYWVKQLNTATLRLVKMMV